MVSRAGAMSRGPPPNVATYHLFASTGGGQSRRHLVRKLRAEAQLLDAPRLILSHVERLEGGSMTQCLPAARCKHHGGVGHISTRRGAHTPLERHISTVRVTGLLVEGLAVRGGGRDRPLGRHSLHVRRRRAPVVVRVAVVGGRCAAVARRRRRARAASTVGRRAVGRAVGRTALVAALAARRARFEERRERALLRVAGRIDLKRGLSERHRVSRGRGAGARDEAR